jgi:hypothetical protein
MLRFAQHDKTDVIPNTLFCHSERQRGIHSWMLRFAQHDKTEDVIPSVSEESTHGCFTSLSMTDRRCHSERQRGIQHMDASLRSA